MSTTEQLKRTVAPAKARASAVAATNKTGTMLESCAASPSRRKWRLPFQRA